MAIGDDEESVWRAISAIHRARSHGADINSLEDAVKILRQELQCKIPRKGKGSSNSVTKISQTGVVRSLIGPTPKVEACIRWLNKTGQFKDVEIRRIRRINLLVEDPSGRISVNKNTISLNTASILLCILCLLSGLWIGWIIFGSQGDIQGIAYSIALGMITGATARSILERSFRFYEIKTKVVATAPWLFE